MSAKNKAVDAPVFKLCFDSVSLHRGGRSPPQQPLATHPKEPRMLNGSDSPDDADGPALSDLYRRAPLGTQPPEPRHLLPDLDHTLAHVAWHAQHASPVHSTVRRW